MADKNKKPRDPIGVIPVDSIFSPVRKVSLRGGEHARRADDRPRPADPGRRDRRLGHAARGGRLGRSARCSSSSTCSPSSPRPRASRSARPRTSELPSDYPITIEELNLSVRSYNCLKREGINTVGDLVQKSRVRADGHPQLRPEVDRRGQGQARGARPGPAGGVDRAEAQEGPRLGSGPGAPAAAAVDARRASSSSHEAINTTEAKAKALRPYAEKLITFAKRGDLAARREVLKDIPDRDVVAQLFHEIGPRFAERRAATRGS